MKKKYNVEVKVKYKIFYEDCGWSDDWFYDDMVINDIERDDIEEYVNKHKPHPDFLDAHTQYIITGVEIIDIKGDGEEEESEKKSGDDKLSAS